MPPPVSAALFETAIVSLKSPASNSTPSDSGTTFQDHLDRTQSKPESAADDADEAKASAPKATAKKSKPAKADKGKPAAAKGTNEPDE